MSIIARCCGGIPNIKIVGEGAVSVDGVGTVGDPIVISSEMHLEGGASSQFEVTVDGEGSLDDPYEIVISYAGTATIAAFPDVSDTAPTAGQVLQWNDGLGQYVPNPVPTAAPGLIATDDSLVGDGSGPDPLSVLIDPDGGLDVTVAGLAVDPATLADTVRSFVDAADRTTNYPAPALNALSTLDTNPGIIYYYNGTAWVAQSNGEEIDANSSIYTFSGPYVDGTPTRRIVRTISGSTDALGRFLAIPLGDLAGLAGILEVNITPIGYAGMGASDFWWPVLIYDNIPIDGINFFAMTSPATRLASKPIRFNISVTVY